MEKKEVKGFVGKQIDILDGNNNIIKTITVAKATNTDYGLILVDTEGEVYTKDELNLSFLMTPASAVFEWLKTEGLLQSNAEFRYETYDKMFERLMKMLENQGFIAKI